MSIPPRRRKQAISPTSDWILLALADGPTHGGAIAGRIIADTVGAYIPDSTLYRLLQELNATGFIERSGETEYRLTVRGRRRLLSQGGLWRRAGQLVDQRLR